MQKEYSAMGYHPMTEKLTEALHKRLPKATPHMLRCLLGYFFCKAASTQRAVIKTEVQGEIPINFFLFNLAPSGIGKNYSVNIIENEILCHFKRVFIEQTLPVVEEINIAKIAVKRANMANEDPDTMKTQLINEYHSLGQMRFSFEKATYAALQQLRQKLIIAKAGAMSLEIDEIGLNLLATNEALTAYLGLFDVGLAKESLTKNTRENTRMEELMGFTPANMLAFGTPSKVYDGGKVEDNFMALNETGFSRRSWNSYIEKVDTINDLTGAERYALRADKKLFNIFKDTAHHFSQLASIANYGRKIILSKKVGIEWFEYQRDCEKRAIPFIDTEETIRAELENRYFKAIKLAGAFAWVDGHAEITMDNLHAAIKLAEDSGVNFYNMLHQEPPYAKMARYIANIPTELTSSDLIEKLPFYKKATVGIRKDMLINAVSWGYKNHIVIKDYMQDGIQFLKGSTLEKTNLDKLKLAYSQHIADGYKNAEAPFNMLHKLTQLKNHHWINHRTKNGHRDEEHMIEGFNMVVLDIDKNGHLKTTHELLKDYKFMTYTTKRHTKDCHRFRLILPLNYEMSMNAEEYRVFMRNIFEWLPFEVDTGAIDRCRKWLTNASGTYYYSIGEKLIDARLFIPKTKRDDERRKVMLDHAELSNLERWFLHHTVNGDRNNQLHRYARVLVDMGFGYEEIKTKVFGLNLSLPEPISEERIKQTIMVTVTKAIGTKNTAFAI